MKYTLEQIGFTPAEQRLITLKNEIYEVFERFSPDGFLTPYRLYEDEEEDEIGENLREVLEEAIEKYRDIVSIYQIDYIDTFEGPGYSTGAIMIALVNEVTGLETFLEQWEVQLI